MGNTPESWFEGTPYLSKWLVLENSSIRAQRPCREKDRGKYNGSTCGLRYTWISCTKWLIAQWCAACPDTHSSACAGAQAGTGGCCSTLSIFVDQIEAGKGVRVLFSDYEVIGDQTHCVLFTSEKFLKENPEAAKRLSEGIAKLWTGQKIIQRSKGTGCKGTKGERRQSWPSKILEGLWVRDHALLADSDAQFWIDWLVKDGKIKKGSSSRLISILISSILILRTESKDGKSRGFFPSNMSENNIYGFELFF